MLCKMHRSLTTIRNNVLSQVMRRTELLLEDECSWSKIGPQVIKYGRTCLVVVDDDERARGHAERPLFELRKVGINCATFTARGVYPTADIIDEARNMAKRVGAASIVGIGGGGVIDIAKATAKLHGSRGLCKQYLESPGSAMLGKGEYDGPPTLQGEQLPLVMLPTSAGAGAFGNERCLVWHPEDEILVAMAESTGERQAVSVALVDPSLCTSLSSEQTVTMAVTALSACVDTLLAYELGNTSSSKVPELEHVRDLSMKGIGAVREGLPRVLEKNDTKARELLTRASLGAGQASAMASATVLPTQLLARAAGSLLCRHSYPSVCATVFPHVIRDFADGADSFSRDSETSEAIRQALSDASSALVGEGSNVEALLSWVENYKRSSEVEATCLSALDSSLTGSELVTNMEQLLALEKDNFVADRLWVGDEIRSIAEQAVG